MWHFVALRTTTINTSPTGRAVHHPPAHGGLSEALCAPCPKQFDWLAQRHTKEMCIVYNTDVDKYTVFQKNVTLFTFAKTLLNIIQFQ